jgi:hypothetical protein
VNGQFYLEVMNRLMEAERRKGAGFCFTTTHLLTPHPSSLNSWRRTRRQSSPTVLLSRCGARRLLLVPDFELHSQNRRFQMTEEVENISLRDLCTLSQNAFYNWKSRWNRCIESGGEYFERHKAYCVVSSSIKYFRVRFPFWTDRACMPVVGN